MRVVVLNGRSMNSRETIHETLQRRFHFPEYYGKNLDALYDLLTCEDRETLILLFDQEALIHQLDNYGKALIQTLHEVALNNTAIRLVQINRRHSGQRLSLL